MANTTAKLSTITLTGADERTDIQELVRLLGEHPYLEIGLLYSATPEGRPRYPSLSWLQEATGALVGRCAIHVCGSAARQQLRAGELSELVGKARRVQVNGIVSAEEVSHLAGMVPILITQHNENNASLATRWAPNHQLLVDASGGRGQTPVSWARPSTQKRVGFAGGLGADNVVQELRKIQSIAQGRFWIDLEGKLRTNDWFDISLCELFLDAVLRAMRMSAMTSIAC